MCFSFKINMIFFQNFWNIFSQIFRSHSCFFYNVCTVLFKYLFVVETLVDSQQSCYQCNAKASEILKNSMMNLQLKTNLFSLWNFSVLYKLSIFFYNYQCVSVNFDTGEKNKNQFRGIAKDLQNSW